MEEKDTLKVKANVLAPGYTARQALLLLLHTDPGLDLQEVEEVYYPYIRFRYLIRVGSGRIMEKLNKISDCIVDRVSGSTYEAKGEPEYIEQEIYREDMLKISIPLHECYDAAHDFTMKMYISKGKLMMTPQMQIIEEEEFYKRFYVVTCLDKQGMEYRIMVDAVDGGISVLDNEYHLELLEKSRNLLPGGVLMGEKDGESKRYKRIRNKNSTILTMIEEQINFFYDISIKF